METVNDRMTNPVLSIEQDESVNKAANKIYDNAIGSLLVTHDKNFIGIITKTDLMIKVLIKNLNGDSTRVSKVMSQPLMSMSPLILPKNYWMKIPFAIWARAGTMKLSEYYPQKTCNNIRLSFPL